MVFTLSTAEIQYLQLQIFFTAGSWFLYPAFMISLQYIAITILHVFWLPQKKKWQGSCFEVLCSVYAWGVCFFWAKFWRDIPGGAGASMLPMLSVSEKWEIVGEIKLLEFAERWRELGVWLRAPWGLGIFEFLLQFSVKYISHFYIFLLVLVKPFIVQESLEIHMHTHI